MGNNETKKSIERFLLNHTQLKDNIIKTNIERELNRFDKDTDNDIEKLKQGKKLYGDVDEEYTVILKYYEGGKMNKEDYQEVLEKMEKATGNEVFCDVMCRFPYELNEEQLTEVCERCPLTESCEDSSQTITNLKKLKSFHNGSYGADIDKVIKALEQTMWIPISERNPKKDGEYLVTVRGLMGEYVKVETLYYAEDLYKIDKFDFIDKQGVAGWYNYDGEWGYYEVDNVIAWMPLPQPYKGESEE